MTKSTTIMCCLCVIFACQWCSYERLSNTVDAANAEIQALRDDVSKLSEALNKQKAISSTESLYWLKMLNESIPPTHTHSRQGGE